MPDSISEDLRTAIEAARKGGEVVARNFRRDQVAEEKAGDKGLVTETDRASERAIIETLQSRSPYSILSEEAGSRSGTSELLWVVDPLDGTTNFARDLPLFGVSIALARGSEILLGVILNPMTDECFYAERGGGCYMNDREIHVSSNAGGGAAVLCANHGYAESDRERFSVVTERLARDHYLRKLGTTAIELCCLAGGSIDAFICSGDELWDFAAGIVLVEEAGGRITDWQGRSWDGSNSFVLASNGAIHDFLVGKVHDLQPADGA